MFNQVSVVEVAVWITSFVIEKNNPRNQKTDALKIFETFCQKVFCYLTKSDLFNQRNFAKQIEGQICLKNQPPFVLVFYN